MAEFRRAAIKEPESGEKNSGGNQEQSNKPQASLPARKGKRDRQEQLDAGKQTAQDSHFPHHAQKPGKKGRALTPKPYR